jgi:hypothetical protein
MKYEKLTEKQHETIGVDINQFVYRFLAMRIALASSYPKQSKVKKLVYKLDSALEALRSELDNEYCRNYDAQRKQKQHYAASPYYGYFGHEEPHECKYPNCYSRTNK